MVLGTMNCNCVSYLWAMWAMQAVQQQLNFALSTKILATVKTDWPL